MRHDHFVKLFDPLHNPLPFNRRLYMKFEKQDLSLDMLRELTLVYQILNTLTQNLNIRFQSQ